MLLEISGEITRERMKGRTHHIHIHHTHTTDTHQTQLLAFSPGKEQAAGLHPFIPSGVISPLISSSILGTYRPGEFLATPIKWFN